MVLAGLYSRGRAFTAREPGTCRTSMGGTSGAEWNVDVLDPQALKKQVTTIVETQNASHKEVLDKVEGNRARKRAVASRGVLRHGGARSSKRVNSKIGVHVDWPVEGGYGGAKERLWGTKHHLRRRA